MNKRSLRPAQSICVFIILALISGELVTAQEVTADDVVCVQCVDKKDLANGAVGRVKISDGAVSNDKIANNAIDSRTLAKDAVGSFQLKRKAVTHDNIRDDAVTPEKIADLVRTISVPANSFSRDPTGTIVTADYQGLRWQADMTGTAAYTLSKPADYAGGDVTIRLFFETTTAIAGTVQFLVRADSLSSGDGWFNITGVTSPAIGVSGFVGFGTLYEQSIEIPASRLGGDWWTDRIQRNAGQTTYEGDIILRAVSFDYVAIQ